MNESKTVSKQALSPLAAALLSLATLSCCVPLGFLGALGLAGATVALQEYRGALIAGSVALLVLGFIQLYGRKACGRPSRINAAIFWLAVALVTLVLLFPQVIATVAAGLS